MARFWVGGTGTWDASTTTHWSSTTGGSGGASVPTAADDVVFNASSGVGTATISGAMVARSLDFLGYTGTFALGAAGNSLAIGDATAGAGNIALRLVSGMTTSITGGGTFSFISTSTTAQDIYTGTKSIGNVTFNGVGGSWQFQDGFTTTSGATVTFTNGTLNTNSQACTFGAFSSANSNTRTLTLGSSVISVLGTSNNTWDFSTSTNLTFNAGTSAITFSGVSTSTGLFHGGGKTFWNVSFTGIGTCGISEANTFNNLTVTGGARSTDTLAIFANQTVSNILTMTGNSAAPNRIEVVCTSDSALIGVPKTITVNGSVSLSNVSFQDMIAAGTAGTWSGTSIGDLNGNTNITFTVNAGTTNSTGGVFRYWNGGAVSANWSASNWSTTSGGATGATVPLPQDTAVFPSGSITGTRTITWDMRRLCHDLDISALGNTAVTFTRGGGIVPFFMGSLTLSRVTTFGLNGSAIFLNGRGSQTITSAGNVLAGGIVINAPGGTYTIQDDTTIGIACQLLQGILDQNNKNMIYQRGFVSNLLGSTRTWKMGTGTTQIGDPTVALTTTTAVVNISNTLASFTLNSTGSNLVFAANSDSFQKQFTGLGLTWGNVTLNTAAAGGLGFDFLGAAGSTTFGVVTIGGGQTIRFSGVVSIIYAAAEWDFIGTSGSLVTVISINTPTRANLTQTSGTATARYTSLKDNNASGGARFVASPAVDAGNNLGWLFPSGFGQALADIKAISSVFAQSQADIKATSSRFAQAQADIDAISSVFAQSQSWIERTESQSAQSQADILTTYLQSAQAQADILATSTGFGQSQADILATLQRLAQAQADILATSNRSGQAQADIKAISSGFAQAQSDILAKSLQAAQAQADILVTNLQMAQTQALIKRMEFGRGQTQADIKALGFAFGQAIADIKAISQLFAQAQADIKATSATFGQAKANIKATSDVFAQVQSLIKRTERAYSQAQSDIKATSSVLAMAQADILATSIQSAQAQARVVYTRINAANAQAYIKLLVSMYGQAQAHIFQTHFLKNLVLSDEHSLSLKVSDTETNKMVSVSDEQAKLLTLSDDQY